MAETIKGNLVIKTQMPVDEAKKQLADLQKTLNNLKLPQNLAGNFSDTFKSLDKEIDKLQKKLNTGLKTNAEITSFEKTSREVKSLYDELDRLMVKLRNTGDSVFAGQTTEEIDNLKKQIDSLKGSLASIGQGNSHLGKLKTDFIDANKYTKALKDTVQDFYNALSKGDTSGMEDALSHLENYANRYSNLANKTENQKAWGDAFKEAAAAANEYRTSIQNVKTQVDTLSNQVLVKENDLLEKNKKAMESAKDAAKSYGDSFSETSAEITASAQATREINSQVDSLVSRISNVVSIAGAFTALRTAIRSAYSDVKELDEAMNSIAIVTDYSTAELWDQVDAYAELAQQMGVSLTGVYNVQKLYYQQGRSTADVTSLVGDTLKLARIAEMEYTDATDAMTVALNAFKLEASDATRVIDVYSQLASHAAVSQKELATAMSKVASMASSVGMSLETTSAFLAQIIETTRESPETAGTALKTILARFGEVKTLIDTGENTGTTDEGEEIDVNKIDTGLKAIGVRLLDTTGQMRNLDDVIKEVAQKWDSLTSMEQRYIATLTAGSRLTVNRLLLAA